MHIEAKFNVTDMTLPANFGKVQTASDGGYESGYEAGYSEGDSDGYTRGHTSGFSEGYAEGEAVGREAGYAEGLAARTYETWTITLADGTIVEKEVALL